MLHDSVCPLLVFLTCAWLQLIMFGSCFGGYCFLPVPRGTFSFSLHLWKHALRRELSFKKGDAVNIIRQIDNNWYEGEFRGRVGIFPMSYVEVSAHVCPPPPPPAQLSAFVSLPPHINRRCRPQRSSNQSVLLPQLKSERSERPLHAITSTLTPTWSCPSER